MLPSPRGARCQRFQRATRPELLTCGDECWVAGNGAHAHSVLLLGDVHGPRSEAFLLRALLLLKHEGDALLADSPRPPLRVKILCELRAVGPRLVILPLEKTPVVLERLRQVVLISAAARKPQVSARPTVGARDPSLGDGPPAALPRLQACPREHGEWRIPGRAARRACGARAGFVIRASRRGGLVPRGFGSSAG